MHVCETCCDRVHAALSGPQSLAVLWVDVEDAMTLRARQRGTGGFTAPIPVDFDATEWRERVRALLVGWLLVLEEDYRASLDDAQDTVGWMLSRLGVYTGRLLASEHAEQLVADLMGWTEDDGTRHDGVVHEGRRLAFKSSTPRSVTVQCPSCPRRVPLDPDAEWIACQCGEAGVPQWWIDMLAPKVDGPMHSADLLVWLRENHRVRTLTEVTLRQWVSRGIVQTTGRDGMGRSLFDPIEVASVVLKRRVLSA